MEMKFLKLSVLALSCLPLVTNAQEKKEWDNIPVPAKAAPGMVWEYQDAPSDDFNYKFDPTRSRAHFGKDRKWYNFYHNTWNGPGTTYWQHDHVAVDGNDLVLRASRNSNTAKFNQPGVSAGCITGENRVLYPVYVEASVSVANIALASDVWLLSPDDTQEIDIIECYGGGDSGNGFFAEFIHLSHHSFIRVPFTDYQPGDRDSWWGRSDVDTWGEFSWNNGERQYVRIGVNWVGPKQFEYYIDGEMVRILKDKAMATKRGDKWHYTYPTLSNGQIVRDSGGFQKTVDFATSKEFSMEMLDDANKASTVSAIDPFRYQGGRGFTKEMDIIINIESQSWHVQAGRTPDDDLLKDDTRNQMKVDWIRVYKPKASADASNNGGNTSSLVIEAEKFSETGGAYDDSASGGNGSGANKASRAINYVNTGDWVEYEIEVPATGTYSTEYTIATPSSEAEVQLLVEGKLVSTTAVPNTGGFAKYSSLKGDDIQLTAGKNTIRIVASGSDLWQWNLDKITLKPVEGSANKLTSIEKTVSEKQTSIYPNPAENILRFISTGNTIEKVNVYNLQGEMVMTAPLNDNALDVSKLNTGVYIFKLEGKKMNETHRVIIK